MDPLTHLMGGVVVAHALSGAVPEPVATLAASAAAVLPDFDFYSHQYAGSRFLKIHHGASHSVAGAAGIALAVAGILHGLCRIGLIPGGSPGFAALWLVAFAGGLTHVFLDGIMHNNGIQAGWPFTRRRWSIPLILAVNPKTVSHRCGDKKISTCMKCQARGSTRNPAAWILTVSGLAGFIAGGNRMAIGVAAWLALVLYLGIVFRLRKTAKRIAVRIDPDFDRASVYPASATPGRWNLVYEQPDGGFKAALVDVFSKSVLHRWLFPPPDIPHIWIRPVERFRRDLSEAVRHVYPEIRRQNGFAEVRFRDLSYLYAYPMEVSTVRVEISSGGDVMQEEYKEIW